MAAGEMFGLDEVFRSLDTDRTNVVWKWKLLEELKESGLANDDPRVVRALEEALGTRPGFEPGQPEWLEWDQFARVAQEPVIAKALQGRLVMPHSQFTDITQGITEIYHDLLDNRDGQVAQYIPSLASADPDKFAISICTADGQVFNIGDTDVPFSIQSTSKVFNLLMAYDELGPEEVHKRVGTEQSGGPFNDPVLSLDEDGVPRNPMINAGAIGTLAMVRSGERESARARALLEIWDAMTGRQRAGSDLETFLAEMETAEGNRKLTGRIAAKDKLMGGSGEVAVEDALRFYTTVCALELDSKRLAAAGATLANGGVAPFTEERVFSADATARALSLMAHCGMYDGSGKFAIEVGLPGKSGVSGNIMLVIPQLRMAMAVHSPRLDPAGNSVRGLEVCRRLVNQFNLHPYRQLGVERGRETAVAWSGPQSAPAPYQRLQPSNPAYLAFGGVSSAAPTDPRKAFALDQAATTGSGDKQRGMGTEK
ncbi:L-glutaminase [Kribbella antiqua]|uniref:Glutaminase n=1 Tax=Kribbella antiqua TaxID=2512217 RepID=A0A4R2IJS6_9ACTN|nr:glutaminase A [Kribbella antiqua]TCO44516.1 L-glutaminase [Kribbella antiqua]